MNPQREMSERALGKHIGHACEGHLRGLLKHLAQISAEAVTRRLPFDFPVNPDVVLLDSSGQVRAVLIVAFWSEAASSHKKLHRTRLEYNELLRAYQTKPKYFSSDFDLITVVYGPEGGWKEQVLEDLAKQCAPLIFLPSVLGGSQAERIIQRAFAVYREIWESGRTDVREAVETHFAEAELTAEESLLLRTLQSILDKKPRHSIQESPIKYGQVVKLPEGPFSTRLRQSLGVLALFSPEEVEARLTNRKRIADSCSEDFARRAFFLDLGWFLERKSLLGSTVLFHLRRPVRVVGSAEVYAPDLPDFTDWTRLRPDLVAKILSTHRDRTRNPTRVFRGGAYDQIAGNWTAICPRLTKQLPVLVNAIEQGARGDFVRVLGNEEPVTAPAWHPACQMAWHFPLWAFIVCAVAIAQNRRAIRGVFDTRRQEPASAREASDLFQVCSRGNQVSSLLRDLTRFSTSLQSDELCDLCNVERPLLLSLNEPCSWLADFYNTLTTNSSHNPLNEVVSPWLKQRFPGLEWHGWPERRSRSLHQVIGPVSGRRQWQFVGVDRANQWFCAAEVKSITQNHWGDKSKEIYDRVAETRAAARELGWQCHTLCVLDGDIGTEQLEELSTGIGHDEIVCIDTVLTEFQETN